MVKYLFYINSALIKKCTNIPMFSTQNWMKLFVFIKELCLNEYYIL